MNLAVTVYDKDLGWNAILESVAKTEPLAAYVGPDPDDITSEVHRAKWRQIKTYFGKRLIAKVRVSGWTQRNVRAYYPAFVEYGTRRMPARPYMRWTLDAHDNYLPQMAKLAARLVDKGRSGDNGMLMVAGLRRLANAVANDIRLTIQALGAIDTGRMYRSVKCLRITSGDSGKGSLSVSSGWGS